MEPIHPMVENPMTLIKSISNKLRINKSQENMSGFEIIAPLVLGVLPFAFVYATSEENKENTMSENNFFFADSSVVDHEEQPAMLPMRPRHNKSRRCLQEIPLNKARLG